MKTQKRDPRHSLLAALFVKAQNRGIDADELREDIAPTIIGKRLSEASAREIVRLLDHVTKLYKTAPHPTLPREWGGEKEVPGSLSSPVEGEDKKAKHYDSSRAGLIEELEDTARARWGAEFERPLNEFVNHNRKARTHYKFLKVADMKALKERLKELHAKLA